MDINLLGPDGDLTHVPVRGRLDATTVADVEDQFLEDLTGQQQPAIIDLTEVEFVASRGIGMLITANKRLKQQGHKMVLLNPQAIVASVFKTMKMEMLMPITSSLAEAIRTLDRDPADYGEQDAATPTRELEQTGTTFGSPSDGQSMTVAINNELSELDVLTEALHGFIDEQSVPPRAGYAIDLAIEELVVNVINYAYVDDDEHAIEVSLSIEGPDLVLRIEDDGRPFDPREGPEFNPHAEDRDAGGLGLILVLEMVDVLKYQRADDRNRVEVRVYLPAAEMDADLPAAAGDVADDET